MQLARGFPGAFPFPPAVRAGTIHPPTYFPPVPHFRERANAPSPVPPSLPRNGPRRAGPVRRAAADLRREQARTREERDRHSRTGRLVSDGHVGPEAGSGRASTAARTSRSARKCPGCGSRSCSARRPASRTSSRWCGRCIIRRPAPADTARARNTCSPAHPGKRDPDAGSRLRCIAHARHEQRTFFRRTSWCRATTNKRTSQVPASFPLVRRRSRPAAPICPRRTGRWARSNRDPRRRPSASRRGRNSSRD